MDTVHTKKKLNTYLCKGSWRGTALKFYVEAKDEEEAYVKACREVWRNEGAATCMGIEILGQR